MPPIRLCIFGNLFGFGSLHLTMTSSHSPGFHEHFCIWFLLFFLFLVAYLLFIPYLNIIHTLVLLFFRSVKIALSHSCSFAFLAGLCFLLILSWLSPPFPVFSLCSMVYQNHFLLWSSHGACHCKRALSECLAEENNIPRLKRPRITWADFQRDHVSCGTCIRVPSRLYLSICGRKPV